MGESGKVDGWMPRFIMPPLDLGAPADYHAPEPGPDFDIPVTTKT